MQRGLSIDQAHPERGDPEHAASVRFSLARVLAARGEHELARALAEQARSRWQALGEAGEEARREVERWLAQPPR